MLRIMLRLHYASAAVETVALICFFLLLFLSHLLFTLAFSFGGKRSGTRRANGGICIDEQVVLRVAT